MSSNVVHLRIVRAACAVSMACAALHQVYAQDAASEPAGRGVADVAQAQAHVVGIDPATNSVTLQGASGRAMEVAVDPQIGDVSKLRLGDIVNIEYRDAVLMRAVKAAPGAIRERIETEAAIPASGGITARARTVEVMATIQHIDAKKRLVTLRGPERTVTLAVPPDVSLTGLKKGDMVHAQFESATAVQVLRDGQPIR
jgi:Cu/Ag efflux protein CusF